MGTEAVEAVAESLTDDLAKVWDEIEEKDDGNDGSEQRITTEATGVDNTDADTADERVVQAAEETADSGAEDSPNLEKPDAVDDDTPIGDAQGESAPVGLPPTAREAWKDTPKAMQEAIAKREADYASGIQQYAENSKRAQQMDQALAPFQQYFAMNGNQPGQTIKSLLETASILQMGSPIQRAQMVSNLIGQFGVDIATLDNILTGQAPPEGAQQQNAVQQAVQQAVQPYQQFMQQQQQAQQAQAQTQQNQVASEVETFATDGKNEFYNDVKGDMADILDMAANRGQNMSLKDAYDKACLLHPEIGTIMASRTSAAEVAKKRKAAASIRGTPGGPGEMGATGNLHSAIEEAWDNTGRA